MSPRLNRRKFLIHSAQAAAAIAGGGAALSCAAIPHGGRGKESRPNIIFILTDDQRADAMGCAGHPFLKTPNIDRLASEGVIFRNAFVTTALCSPSRASFHTGCYAFRHGVVANLVNDPDPALPTLPELLQEAGYDTAHVGKFHQSPSDEPRPGYNHWVSFRGQGGYDKNTLNVDGERIETTNYITDELTERAIAFVQRERKGPFFMAIAHKALHGPFKPAERHKDVYKDEAVATFDDADDNLQDKPLYIQAGARKGREKLPVAPPPGFIKDYYRTLSAVDEGLGRLMDALEAGGQLENTAIIFAGDNGHFMGEHGGQGDKRQAYEEPIRIPLLMRWPGEFQGGTKCDAMTLNIDLAPTVLEMAGIEAPATMHGRSWLAPARGGQGRKRFLIEYYNEVKYRPQGGIPGVPTILALRTEDWKYITHPEDAEQIDELYDLKSDPKELRNLAQKTEHADKLREMRSEFEGMKKETGYAAPTIVRRENPDTEPLAGTPYMQKPAQKAGGASG